MKCGAILEVVQKYVYFGQTLQLGRNNFEDEVNRRIQLSIWETTSSVFIVNTTKSKDESLNQCVLPVMTYGAETWILMARLVHKFKVAQQAVG
jgi:hypothetical protein